MNQKGATIEQFLNIFMYRVMLDIVQENHLKAGDVVSHYISKDDESDETQYLHSFIVTEEHTQLSERNKFVVLYDIERAERLN